MRANQARQEERRNSARDTARSRALELLITHHGVIDSLTDEQIRASAAMPVGPAREIGRHRTRD